MSDPHDLPSQFAEASAAFVARRAHHAHERPGASVVHEYAALALCVSGRGVLELGARWSISEGDVLLVPAGASHRALVASDLSLWMVGLSPVVAIAEQQLHLLEPFERVRSGGAAVVHIALARRGFLLQLLVELQRELAASLGAPRQGSRLQHSLLTLLMAEVSRATAAVADSTAVGLGERDEVATCLHYIERNCLRPLSLAELAAVVHRSPAYVTTLLRKRTGKTAGQWILAGRMAEARRRLVHSDEHVDIIAERVGYADATHFTRLFRRVHGLTPSAFRAKPASAHG